jgi:transposase-like protein
MARKSSKDETLIRIEETQSALRRSIEQARALAEDSERLVRKHRDEKAALKPPNPAR